jgi:biotin transport system substrate-specific component
MDPRALAQIAMFAALIAALGLVPFVTLPITGGVPIIAQNLGVMLAGALLGPFRGALAVLLFLLCVALGAPLLTGGRGGLGVFAGPTVGYLIAWPIAAFVIGLMMRALRSLPVMSAALIAALVGGVGVVYAIGVPVQAMMVGLGVRETMIAAAAFLPGDLVKVILVGLIVKAVARARPSLLPGVPAPRTGADD